MFLLSETHQYNSSLPVPQNLDMGQVIVDFNIEDILFRWVIEQYFLMIMSYFKDGSIAGRLSDFKGTGYIW